MAQATKKCVVDIGFNDLLNKGKSLLKCICVSLPCLIIPKHYTTNKYLKQKLYAETDEPH